MLPSRRVAALLAQLCTELSINCNLMHKLDVMEGDLAQDRLGLCDIHYSTLCNSVDLVIHNGAVVNAVLPYASKLYPLTQVEKIHFIFI